MYYKKLKGFPDNFLWGAATSAYQVEGAVTEGGKKKSIVDIATEGTKFADNSVSSDHYHRYKEDVALMVELGLKAYRFSIAWSRILPDGTGEVNNEGVEFYHNLIDELLKNNITPIITIYHYDLPVALRDRYGGWLSRQAVDDYIGYCQVIFREYGNKVKYWLTINEPDIVMVVGEPFGLAPNGVEDYEKTKYQITHHLVLAHARAVNLCHQMVNGGKIGPVLCPVPVYPETCKPEDVLAALNAEEIFSRLFTDLYLKGEYTASVWNFLVENNLQPKIEPGDLEVLKSAKCDFTGVNYYSTYAAKHCSAEEAKERTDLNVDGVKGTHKYPKESGVYQLTRNKYVEVTDWDWEIDPVGMRIALRNLYNRYKLPIIITENGLGAFDTLEDGNVINDDYRIDYLAKHIEQCRLAINDGVELMGYCPWSFIDLLSTSNGFHKRYGFVYVNRTDEDTMDLKRIKKKSFNWYQNVIKTNGEEL